MDRFFLTNFVLYHKWDLSGKLTSTELNLPLSITNKNFHFQIAIEDMASHLFYHFIAIRPSQKSHLKHPFQLQPGPWDDQISNLSCCRFTCRYWGNSCWCLSLRLLICLSSAGSFIRHTEQSRIPSREDCLADITVQPSQQWSSSQPTNEELPELQISFRPWEQSPECEGISLGRRVSILSC